MDSDNLGFGYKLFKLRSDGSLGPLFINRTKVIEPGIWYPAESHPTKGYAYRPYWHICSQPHAPHLSKRGRVWRQVRFVLKEEFQRPAHQGGVWYLASWMMLLEG